MVKDKGKKEGLVKVVMVAAFGVLGYMVTRQFDQFLAIFKGAWIVVLGFGFSYIGSNVLETDNSVVWLQKVVLGKGTVEQGFKEFFKIFKEVDERWVMRALNACLWLSPLFGVILAVIVPIYEQELSLGYFIMLAVCAGVVY